LTDNRTQFRIDATTENALSKARQKWPILNQSELLRKIIEQWNQLQDSGTSKTQKLADIDARLAEYSVLLAQLSESSISIADRVTKLGDLFAKIYPVIVEMKEQLAQHGFEEE